MVCVWGGGGGKVLPSDVFYIQDNIKKIGMADDNSLALNA